MNDSEQLARYLAGEATAAERNNVERWLAEDPANRRELDRLAAAWADRPPVGDWNVDQAWAAVAARLDRPAPVEVIPIRRGLPLGWIAAAAVVVVTAGAIWTAGRNQSTEYHTAIGEQRQITLADGSTVVMAPASRLVVAGSYGRPVRDVELTGRAWFVVTHDEAKPFRVTTTAAMVEDLGTEFEVDATGPAMKVAVASGAVAVHRTGAETVRLAAGDLATVANGGEAHVSHEMPIDRMTSWRAGTLDFIDRPLDEVAAELERWYDIQVVIEPGIGTKPFNGPIPTDDLTQALTTIETAFGELRLARTGRTVTIGPRAP
ncbi:MAG: FecR family protein [Gemmatimonadales bacterium]